MNSTQETNGPTAGELRAYRDGFVAHVLVTKTAADANQAAVLFKRAGRIQQSFQEKRAVILEKMRPYFQHA